LRYSLSVRFGIWDLVFGIYGLLLV
jgi:hypothetical protein